MLLYHFNNPAHALHQIKRVLRPEGWAGITTFTHDTGESIYSLAHQLESSLPSYAATIANFDVEVGQRLLPSFFSQVEMKEYTSHLEITDAKVITNFLASSVLLKDLKNKDDFLSSYYSTAEKIIKQQGQFETKFEMTLFLCKP